MELYNVHLYYVKNYPFAILFKLSFADIWGHLRATNLATSLVLACVPLLFWPSHVGKM